MSLALSISPGPALRGALLYVTDDHAFDFVPRDAADLALRCGPTGTGSLAIGTLQIEVDCDTGALLYPWGFYPETAWAQGTVASPEGVQEGLLSLERSQVPPPGVARGIEDAVHPQAVWDNASGWMRFGEEHSDRRIEFAEGSVAGFSGGHLACLWLRPEFRRP